MKKISIALIAVFILNSCVKKIIDPLGGGCLVEATKFTETIGAFSADPKNKQKCEAYVNAIKTYVKNCTLIPASEKKTIDQDIKDLNCNDLGN